jgi:hypothetical protein
MAERKHGAPLTGKPQSQPPNPPTPATNPPAKTTTGAKEGRKPWVKKTPVEVVLEQIGKQEEKVNDLREELKKEERELQKLQQAKKVLEATD